MPAAILPAGLCNRLSSTDVAECNAAWAVVIRDIETGKLLVDAKCEHSGSLLHFAASGPSATVMERLLQLGAQCSKDRRGYGIGHYVDGETAVDCIQKLKLLPPEELCAKDNIGMTPLHVLARDIKTRTMWGGGPGRDKLVEVLAWLLQQPQVWPCLESVDIFGHTILHYCDQPSAAMVAHALERLTRRWSPARAAWTAAVVAAAF
jgi:hypothetical protein